MLCSVLKTEPQCYLEWSLFQHLLMYSFEDTIYIFDMESCIWYPENGEFYSCAIKRYKPGLFQVSVFVLLPGL